MQCHDLTCRAQEQLIGILGYHSKRWGIEILVNDIGILHHKMRYWDIDLNDIGILEYHIMY